MEAGKPKPVYLLAGGRRSNNATRGQLVQNVLNESGVASPSIAYIGAANGDNGLFFRRIANLFKKAGARKVTHALIYSDKADLEKAQDVLDSADIIFVSGGDVEEGMRVLKEKNMLNLLRGLYEEGKPFFGLSAGSIMLAKKWVRWSDPNDDSTAKLFPCLGFAPVICDTHGEDDCWEELRVALKLEKDEEEGYGIVSGAAIKVYPRGRVEALGLPVHRYVRRENRVIRVSDLLTTVRQIRIDRKKRGKKV